MKAAAIDADFQNPAACPARQSSAQADFWGELTREHERYKKGLGLRETSRASGRYSQRDVLEYLQTLAIADPDELLDFTYHLAELYGLPDLAAAAVLARSERYLVQDNTAVASLLALIAMEASLRAANKGLLNKSAHVFARSSPSEAATQIVSQLQAPSS